MTSFQINNYHQLYQANDIKELKKLAEDGTLQSSDLIKPDGSNEWLYAGELPGIKELLLDEEEETTKSNKVLGIIVLLLAVGGFFQAYQFQTQIPSASDLELVGSNALQEDQAMLTDNAKLYQDQEARNTMGVLDKNSIVTLKKKKGERFFVESSKGNGWISMYDIAPAYLFAGSDIKNKYDARFNAHRKIHPFSASWERPVYGSDITLFFLQLQNTTPYTVEDIVVQINIKDDGGNVVHVEKLVITGQILAGDTSKIGTLNPEKGSDDLPQILTISELERREKTDPSVTSRWVESIEMNFGKGKFSGAAISVTQANTLFKE